MHTVSSVLWTARSLPMKPTKALKPLPIIISNPSNTIKQGSVFMHDQNNYKKLFEDFNNLTILIIGDVMMDSYLWGKVERISPEAPIPIVALKKKENRMGGAANVAMNIKAMGAKPILCSVIGDDAKGNSFLDLLEKEEIACYGIDRESVATG